MASSSRPKIWIIGSGRLHLRIPLMQRLTADGFEVAAVGPDKAEEFDEAGFTYHRFPLRRALDPVGDWHARDVLEGLMKQHRPDLVHSVNTKPSILVPSAAARANIPACVRTITGMGALFSSSSPKALAMRWLYRRLQRRAAPACQATVFQNPDDQKYFKDHGLFLESTDELVLSSGIDVEPYIASAGSPAARAALKDELGLGGKPVITMVSRLIHPKGIAEFLEAASLVRARNPQVTFLLIGPEVHEGPTAFPAERVHRCPDVRFLGRRADVPTLLAISDLFVLPTYLREGVPRVLLEAGALGLPLVTTDVPGCREVVRHGENGVLVPERDGQTLASTIFDLLADPARRQRMGRTSRELVTERFHLDIVSAAYARIYRQALGIGESESRDITPMKHAA